VTNSIIIIGPSELRTERFDFVRERCDCVRIGLSNSVGRRGAYYDLIAAVYDRPLHGTPWISEPRVQTRNARNEERSSGVQSGKFSTFPPPMEIIVVGPVLGNYALWTMKINMPSNSS